MPLGDDNNNDNNNDDDKPLGLTEDSLTNLDNDNPDNLDDDLDNDDNDNNDDDGLSDVEKIAMEQGWTPKEDFKGNPDNWKPAAQYVEWGEMKNSITTLTKSMKGMRKSHDEEIVNLNKFHKASLEAREQELVTQLEAAVEDGDFDKVKEITGEQGKIAIKKEKLDSESLDNGDQKSDAEIKAEWELENFWIGNAADPRSGVANSAYSLAISRGKSIPEAIEFVDETIAEKFPEGAGDGGGKPKPKVNHNRNNPSRHSNNSGGGNSRDAKLTMQDCTSEELKFRELFVTDEKFLKTVANNRKGA
jgi:hypothetical protein